MILLYTFIFGIFQIIAGLAELILPEKIYTMMKSWVNSPLYFIHGIILILTGFPLTVYKGSLSTAVFIIGIVIVFMGPVVLFYPEKIRSIFNQGEADLGDRGLVKVVRAEAMFRIGAGLILITGYLLSVR